MYDLREPLLSVGVLQQKSDSIYRKNKQFPPTSKHEDKKVWKRVTFMQGKHNLE